MTLNLYLNGDKFSQLAETKVSGVMRRIMPLLFPSLYQTEELKEEDEDLSRCYFLIGMMHS